MSWFKRESGDYESDPGGNGPSEPTGKNVRTEGLWTKCPGCRAVLYKGELESNLFVCPKCQYHFKIGARQRIDMLLEPGYELVDTGLRSTDPLNFSDVKPYKQRLQKAQEQTGLSSWVRIPLCSAPWNTHLLGVPWVPWLEKPLRAPLTVHAWSGSR